MVQISRLATLAVFCAWTSAKPINDHNVLNPMTRANIGPQQVAAELGPLLSAQASIFGPDDSQWDDANENWNEYGAPHFTVVVVAGQESDIPIITQYANRNDINFYARSRGHALTESRAKFTGLQINLKGLQNITVSEDKTYATIQGGVYGQELADTLWEQDLIATTGSCSCVGLLGAGLGGGWGKLQGFHGVISDNLRSLNVVLANGSAITVSSTAHPDLYWAMQGAGHNFGIVTSFELNVWPRMYETWFQKNYIFTEDKLEALFEQLNILSNNGSQQARMAESAGYYVLNNSIDATKATITWQFSWAGPAIDAQPYLQPFDDLDPVYTENYTVPYPELAAAATSSVGQPLCEEGLSRQVAPATLLAYNLTTQRQIYNLFNEKVFVHPELTAAFVVMETYPQEVSRTRDPDSSAYPWRAENVYTTTTISYTPNSTFDEFAIEWVTANQKLFNEGQPGRNPVSYVNYGSGRESLEATYGYEPWRLERLRALKAIYDPDNKFAYFAPVIPPS